MSLPHFLPNPIQLIHWRKEEATGKEIWTLDDDAVRFLRTIDQPISVLAIVGLYRTGKSFLLNQLCNRQDGFDIGPTIEPCTHGIWLWEIPNPSELNLPQMLPNSRVLLLDTEGLGSYTQSETYDVQLFSLALLLSSYFIYNSVGQIDEGAIEKLSLVVELTKHIHLYSQQQTAAKKGKLDPSKANASELGQYFPTFLWLVRDFALQLLEDGREITMNQYLEKVLSTQAVGRHAEANNQIRRCITGFFRERECFCMRRPVVEEEQLQQMATLSPDAFRPEYLEQLGQLKQNIYSKLQPKFVSGRAVNGHMFAELAQSYVRAINEGTVPTIATAWEAVVASECRRAVQCSLASFENGIATAFSAHESRILEQEVLSDAGRAALQEAIRVFHGIAVGDNTLPFEEEVFKSSKLLLQTQQSANETRSRELCLKVTAAIASAVHALFRDGQLPTIDALALEIDRVCAQYLGDTRGPARYPQLTEFLKAEGLQLARQIAAAQMDVLAKEHQERLDREQQRAEGQYHSLQLLHDDLQQRLTLTLRERDETAQQNTALQTRLTDALEELAKLRGTLSQVQTEDEKVRQTLREVTVQKEQIDVTLKQVTEERDTLKKKKRCVIM